MLRVDTAPGFQAFRRPAARASTNFPLRRDPRRFGQAAAWLVEEAADETDVGSDDLRLFAQSFAGFFLFFSLLIA